MTALDAEHLLAEIEAHSQRCDICQEPAEVLIVRRDSSEVCLRCFLQAKGVRSAKPQEARQP